MNQDGSIGDLASGQVQVLHIPLDSEVSLDMVLVEGGMYSMGSYEPDAFGDERPRHLVRVKTFYLSQTTVTQAQWKAVMKRLPPCRAKGMRMPVDRVSYVECERFLRAAARVSGESLRFPCEAEWEYACRASTHSAFSFGNMVTTDVCNYVGAHSFRDGPIGVYRHGPVESKTFPPNQFGIYEMHGNLWEWCADRWHADYNGAPLITEAWLTGGSSERVLRGGSWHDPPNLCRSAARLKLSPAEGEDFVGLRVAMSVPETETAVGTAAS